MTHVLTDPKHIQKVIKWSENARHHQKLKNVFVNDRIYIDFQHTQKNRPNRIFKFLKEHDFEVVDYVKGLCKNNKNNQTISIGKALNKVNAAPKLIKFFVNDPKRNAFKKNKKIVFTINAFDVAAMSTNRGWTSCMDLNEPCGNLKKLKYDIKYGTIIAYLINEDDLDIKAPVARILLKPFFTKNGDVAYFNEEKVYGSAPASFKKQVKKWCETNFPLEHPNMFYRKPSSVYNDGVGTNKAKIDSNVVNLKFTEKEKIELMSLDVKNAELFQNEKLLCKVINSNPFLIKDLKVKTKKLQIIAVSKNAQTLKYIKNADDEVKEIAVRKISYAINFIKNPSRELILIALDQNPYAIQWIKNPDEDILLELVHRFPSAIAVVKNPSLNVQIEAVKQNPIIIDRIKNPNIEVVKYALEHSHEEYIISYDTEQTEEMQLLAVKKNVRSIRYIKTPTRNTLIEVLKRMPEYISHIKEPDEEMIMLSKINENSFSKFLTKTDFVEDQKIMKIVFKNF